MLARVTPENGPNARYSNPLGVEVESDDGGSFPREVRFGELEDESRSGGVEGFEVMVHGDAGVLMEG